ncbi:hypothetical protein G3I59_11775 [Amycolatopsis rubida]|uniref:Uncharacterized protein n=1 Tax=Amycolatopsis rubida TaxID=112413 RepID=A0A1I5IYH3_9PSEU|nr:MULTISPECIES: hypothetical protein [Amycolatopsis]MYW91262.1 hypothetical protein [Amycolatopsis rubida]NEC56247.1 hypothetical protein [Amycolatopsis rubida]OAP28836.1 hypothetical protein A4R44_00628 [Amycolatopsis sp. M39]SFO65568.1 hypothetical protein SAMN05421854_102790 [Amycolatopsis rubida]
MAPADLEQARIFRWIQVALSAIGPLLPLIFAGLAVRTRDVRTWFFPPQPSVS